jgi:hypothetical protein
MTIVNYEDFERTFGFDIPNKLKYIDKNGPPRTHIAFLKNERTNKLLAYGEEKRIHQPTCEDVRNKFHAEQALLYNINKVRNKVNPNEWRGPKTIISARFSKCGFIGNSKFCSSCAKLLLKKCSSYVDYVAYFENKNLCKVPIKNICKDTTYSTSLQYRHNLRSMNA